MIGKGGREGKEKPEAVPYMCTSQPPQDMVIPQCTNKLNLEIFSSGLVGKLASLCAHKYQTMSTQLGNEYIIKECCFVFDSRNWAEHSSCKHSHNGG